MASAAYENVRNGQNARPVASAAIGEQFELKTQENTRLLVRMGILTGRDATGQTEQCYSRFFWVRLASAKGIFAMFPGGNEKLRSDGNGKGHEVFFLDKSILPTP